MSNSLPDQPAESKETAEFNAALAEVERSLTELKQRHAQVLQDQQRQTELTHRRERIHQQTNYRSRSELREELSQIEKQLDELEVNLESRLFNWTSLQRPFWQIVRFGGLGLIIGWGLAYATLRSPQPLPPPPPPVERQ